MKIKMIKSQNVSPNGIKVERWMKDTIHEVEKELGNTLVKVMKVATVVRNPIVQPIKPGSSEIKVIKENGKVGKKKK